MWDPVEKALSLLIEPQISPFRGPLYFARPQNPALGPNVIANGGFGLVDTGKRKLLITCNHVWESLREAQRKDPDVRLHLCLDLQRKQALVFDQHDPIDQDANLDIAVFDMEPVLAACAGRMFYPLHQNPAPRLKNGSKIVLLGNQGINREGLDFGLTIYALVVSSVDEMRFHARMSEVQFRNLREPTRLPNGSPHGGISGNPCFLVRPDRACQLVGFVNGYLMDYLCFTHARSLRPDGTLNKQGKP